MVLDSQMYRCECEPGFHGVLCNLKGEAARLCQGLPCVHGQCEETGNGESCTCKPGFTGQSCDIGETCGASRVSSKAPSFPEIGRVFTCFIVHTWFSPGKWEC